MKSFISLFIAVFCNVALPDLAKASFSEEDLIVDAGPLGRIRGFEDSTTGDGAPPRPYISFLGMKYADASTNASRFLPSERYNERLNDTGEFYAGNEGPACIQPNLIPILPIPMSEDCLKIHVFTPKPYKGNDSELLPVLFFIHGGAFTAGQGSVYSGKRLLNKDVVVVSFNYRLGVLGFFSLKTENAPGNAGLYDIVNALKWTRDYIRYFGGNPDKITIAGQSAGSVAVTHLLASPLARGLFHGAIASSGTALAAWGTTVDPFIDSLKIANLAGCYNISQGYNPSPSEVQFIINCMRYANHQKLVEALFNFQVSERREGRLGFAAVSPTVQDFATSAAFPKILEKHPQEVFKAGEQANVPLMMGANRHDGSYVLGVFYERYLKANNYVNETHSDQEFMAKEAVPRILEALGIPDEYGVYDSIAKMYLGDTRKSGNFWEMYPGLIDLFSVFFFKASSYQTALYHSQLNKQTFWYSFDFQGKNSLFAILFGLLPPPIKSGITHSDDLIYVFDIPLMTLSDPDDITVSNRMVEYWTNFATYGTPTVSTSQPAWPALNTDNATFLCIDKESSELQHYDNTWNDLGWELLPPTETPSPSTSPSGPPEDSSTVSSPPEVTSSTASSPPEITSSTGSSPPEITSSTSPPDNSSPSESSTTDSGENSSGVSISSCTNLIVVFLTVQYALRLAK